MTTKHQNNEFVVLDTLKDGTCFNYCGVMYMRAMSEDDTRVLSIGCETEELRVFEAHTLVTEADEMFPWRGK